MYMLLGENGVFTLYSKFSSTICGTQQRQTRVQLNSMIIMYLCIYCIYCALLCWALLGYEHHAIYYVEICNYVYGICTIPVILSACRAKLRDIV